MKNAEKCRVSSENSHLGGGCPTLQRFDVFAENEPP